VIVRHVRGRVTGMKTASRTQSLMYNVGATQRPIQRRRPLRARKPKRPKHRRHQRQSENAQRRPSSPSPLPPPYQTNPLPAHHLHRRRDPQLFLPSRHHERRLRQHARAAEGDDDADVADGGEDGGGVEGVGGVFCGGLDAVCVCVVVLMGGERWNWGSEG